MTSTKSLKWLPVEEQLLVHLTISFSDCASACFCRAIFRVHLQVLPESSAESLLGVYLPGRPRQDTPNRLVLRQLLCAFLF